MRLQSVVLITKQQIMLHIQTRRQINLRQNSTSYSSHAAHAMYGSAPTHRAFKKSKPLF